MRRSVLSLSAALGLLVAAGAAQASIVVYTTQASFNAAITAPGVDTFNSLPLSSVPSPINRSAGAYTYTGAVSTTSFFTAGTLVDVWLSTNTATDTITFNNFGGGVQAAGGFFFTSDINGAFAAGDITITATDSSGTVTQTIVGSTTLSFLGFVSDGSLLSVTVSAVQPAGGGAFVWPTVNDFTLAQNVPAPAAAALIGLGGLVAGRRRR